MSGDTIVRVNGLAATEQIMGSPFEPGDTVVLRIRRDGRERDVTLVAAPRTQRPDNLWTYALPDSAIQGRMSIIMRDVQARLDTMARGGGFRFEQIPGDSNVVFRFGNDSIRIFRDVRGLPGAVFADSVLGRMAGMYVELDRVLGDSARFRVFGDSTRVRMFGDSGVWRMLPDSARFMRPAEALTGSLMMGMRAVAGAELSDLNPGLAEYFGVMNGVLVLDARDGTPAARAGLQPGDVITRANDTAVASISDLRRAVAAVPPGTAVQLRVLRRGQPLDLTLGR